MIKIGDVAQLVEQRPFKPWVLGSNPSVFTKKPVAHTLLAFFTPVHYIDISYTKIDVILPTLSLTQARNPEIYREAQKGNPTA